MAAGENGPELGGYDYEFTSRVPEDWECPVCCLTLKDPVQIVGCGHRLCNICIESLLRSSSPRCPVDRQPLSREKIFPDAACHRKILNLAVKCSHSGCSWTGELRAVEEHQSECLYKVVKCSNSGCTKTFSKRDIKTHETLECSWRKVDCEYCQESVIMNQKQKHFKTCRTFPVLCTNKCGLRDIPREKLEAHILDECPATEVQCEYKNLGCQEVFPRSAAKSHSQMQIESHLSLALRGLEATQNQVHELVTVVKEQSQQIERQSQQIKELISKDKEQLQQIKQQSQQIEKQSQQIERQSQQIEKLISKDKEQSEKMKRLMSTAQDHPLQRERQSPQIERQSQQIERQSKQIEKLIPKDKEQSEKMERPMSTFQYDPLQGKPRWMRNMIFPTPFLWRIPNSWTNQAEDLLSEEFHLFERGYKYRMKISSCSSSSRDVYIKLVSGTFDNCLSWPCKEKVRVTVMDPENSLASSNKISGVIDLENDREPCNRPVLNHLCKYHLILRLNALKLINYRLSDTIVLMVSRENSHIRPILF